MAGLRDPLGNNDVTKRVDEGVGVMAVAFPYELQTGHAKADLKGCHGVTEDAGPATGDVMHVLNRLPVGLLPFTVNEGAGGFEAHRAEYGRG